MNKVAQHYTRENLFETILAALEKSGVDRQHVTRKDIAAVDEFHVRGQEVSNELAQQADLRKGCRVLDVGCGLGGPCRMLAEEYACNVTGIDITPEYIDTATRLSALTGLQHNTRFITASALDLPFDNESFDTVWTQHVQMNIEDKHRFYSEIARVLVKGGQFVYYDIFRNSNAPLYFPVPWASEPAISHLVTTDALHTILNNVGLHPVNITDQTVKGIQFFDKMLARIEQQGPPAIGLNLLAGPDFKNRFSNLYKNLVEEKVVLESGICIREW